MLDRYPSASTDPRSRREYMRKRNARIQKQDEQQYLSAVAEQEHRAHAYQVEQHKQRDKRTR